jgi:hypothetical protein
MLRPAENMPASPATLGIPFIDLEARGQPCEFDRRTDRPHSFSGLVLRVL